MLPQAHLALEASQMRLNAKDSSEQVRRPREVAPSSRLYTAHDPLACLHQIALESANKTIETLRHELSSMDVHSSMKERLDLQARVSKLEGQLAQEEAKVAASAQEAASLRKHGAGLQRRIDELQGQIGELNGTIADLRRSMGGVVRTTHVLVEGHAQS